MHKYFADWHQAVAIKHDKDNLQLRWEGIELALKDIKPVDILELVKLVFKWPAKQTDFLDQFRQYFKSVDVSFSLTGNDKEVQNLAACLLAVLIDDDKRPVTASLAVLTASFNNTRKQDTGVHLVEMAEDRLRQEGHKIRVRPTLKEIKGVTLKKQLEDAIAVLEETPEIEDVVTTLKSFVPAFNTFSNAITKELNLQILALDNIVKIQDEELQTLWWIMGEQSFKWHTPFDKIETNAKPILLGYEYFTITSSLGLPPTFDAILSKIGVDSVETTIPTAVNACNTDELSTIDISSSCPTIFPLHRAVTRAVEAEGEDSWVAAWSKAVSINSDSIFTGRNLAKQLYLEQQLHNCVTE